MQLNVLELNFLLFFLKLFLIGPILSNSCPFITEKLQISLWLLSNKGINIRRDYNKCSFNWKQRAGIRLEEQIRSRRQLISRRRGYHSLVLMISQIIRATLRRPFARHAVKKKKERNGMRN